MNTVIGALLAAIVVFATGATALLMGEVCTVIEGEQVCRSVENLSDISQVQWVVLILGVVVAFVKDYQAISTRRLVNKVTGTGDGGGTI